jgi:hypothetical protein
VNPTSDIYLVKYGPKRVRPEIGTGTVGIVGSSRERNAEILKAGS